MWAYSRGFWNDRGTWVFVSVVVSLLAIWAAIVVISVTWDLLIEGRRKGESKFDIAITIGLGVLCLSVPILLAGAPVIKAVSENERWQRHQTNQGIARGIATDLTADGATGNKQEATVWFCLYETLDDWAVFRKGDKGAISRFLTRKRSECMASAPLQSEVDELLQRSGSYGGDSPQGGGDCDIVCVPTPSEDDYIPEPSNDPCEGYNSCIEGPDGRYGEDWINDPWDEPNDGR
jgi:F0F1-type ATP synthase membrane subunit c/vacuolar-type H+-ATPase subunit K